MISIFTATAPRSHTVELGVGVLTVKSPLEFDDVESKRFRGPDDDMQQPGLVKSSRRLTIIAENTILSFYRNKQDAVCYR